MLYLLLAILLFYMSLDFYGWTSCGSSLLERKGGFGDGRSEEGEADHELCSTLQGHHDASLSRWNRSAGDPWQQLKWIGEPAFCRVRGQLIEKLDADNNFRRGYSLKHTGDVEDRMHILPWLMGSRVDLNAAPRRVYLDLGANSFESSVRWFSTIYPCDFTEVHAFEKDVELFRKPEQGFDEVSNWRRDVIITDSVRVKETPNLPQWVLDRITLYNKFVADADDEAQGAINITRFIKEELKLRPYDTVVVKMDIEAAEWPILKRWMNDPEMVAIVDELFVEIHYADITMRRFDWDTFRPRTREEATLLLAELRWRGIFAHFWP